jgi:hypothetical protein
MITAGLPMILVLCMTTLGLQDSTHPVRHALSQSGEEIYVNLCPLLLKCYPHFINISGHNRSSVDCCFQHISDVFDGVEVRD